MNAKSGKADVLIIGAGHNGLVCATYLAKKGLHVTILEAAGTVGGAAVTDEFVPGYRNSAASYTVSLLNPTVIRDLELERHGLKVVLRKIDNFLPGEKSYLLGGRGGLTRAELVRHHPEDGPAYDRYLAELGTVVPLIQKWLLRAPPGPGGGVGGLPALLSLGRDVVGMSTDEVQASRLVHSARHHGKVKVRFLPPDAEPIESAGVAVQSTREVPHLDQVAPIGRCDPPPRGVGVRQREARPTQVFDGSGELQ